MDPNTRKSMIALALAVLGVAAGAFYLAYALAVY
jgi:hypothetical protein